MVLCPYSQLPIYTFVGNCYDVLEVSQMRVPFKTTLDEEVVEDIKIQAIKEKTDVSKIIEMLLIEYLKKCKTKSSD